MTQEFSETAVKRMARRVLEIELEALELSKKSIDDQFLKAVDVIAKTKGRVVVLGIGKSGIIAAKFPPPWPLRVRRLSLCTRWKPCTETWG